MRRFTRYARRIRVANTVVFFAVVIAAAYLGMNFRGFTGFLVSTESFFTVPGFEASQPGEYVWSHEQEGLLSSLKVSGWITGNGQVRLFLQAGEKRFLVLDSGLLNATNASGEGAAPAENETASQAPQEFRFEDFCAETCLLPELNETSYALAFEIENGTTLHIDSMRYSLIRYEKPANQPPAGSVPDQVAVAGEAIVINLSNYFSDPDNETLVYAANSEIEVFADGDLLKIVPAAEGNYTINVSASDGSAIAFSSFTLTVIPQKITEANATEANVTHENATQPAEAAPSALLCSSCLECSEKVSSASPGSYVLLDADISGGEGNCIDFLGALNVTFDCQGHNINGAGSDCGILLNDSDENTIRNCLIAGFYVGIHMDKQSKGNWVFLSDVTGNTHGVSVFSSSLNTMEDVAGRIRVSSSSKNAIKCSG